MVTSTVTGRVGLISDHRPAARRGGGTVIIMNNMNRQMTQIQICASICVGIRKGEYLTQHCTVETLT